MSLCTTHYQYVHPTQIDNETPCTVFAATMIHYIHGNGGSTEAGARDPLP